MIDSFNNAQSIQNEILKDWRGCLMFDHLSEGWIIGQKLDQSARKSIISRSIPKTIDEVVR